MKISHFNLFFFKSNKGHLEKEKKNVIKIEEDSPNPHSCIIARGLKKREEFFLLVTRLYIINYAIRYFCIIFY